MKVFVSTYPYAGHFNPTQPIVRELIRRGHEVLWMSGPAYEARITATGAAFLAMPPDVLVDDEAIHGTPGLPTLDKIIDYLARLFLYRVPAQVREYQAALKDFAADVMLVDYCTFGARCLHDLTGIRYATLGINPLTTLDPEIPPWSSGELPPKTCVGRLWNRFRHKMGVYFVSRRLSAALNREREKLGLEPRDKDRCFIDDMRSPFLHIMMTTPAFEFPRKNMLPQVKFVGPLVPSFDDVEFVEPPWWPEMLAHPREKVIHLTQGTVVTNSANLVRPTIRALADRDDLLIIATGKDLDQIFERDGSTAAAAGDDDEDLIPRPTNVRTAAFIPHPKLLPHVGVMVTNAGYNGVLAALSHGVPLVCAGMTEDKADVSTRVAWAGAGINLRTNKPKIKAVRRAVLKIITESKYREAAGRVRDDFATHNPPAEAAYELEKLAIRCWM